MPGELSIEQQKDLVELLFDEAQALRAWAAARASLPEERFVLRCALNDRALDLEQRATALRNQMQGTAVNPGGTT